MTRERIEDMREVVLPFVKKRLLETNYEGLGEADAKEFNEILNLAIKALEQETSRDMEEIEEVINCDADAETKCKMISNILTAKQHYFEDPQESEE